MGRKEKNEIAVFGGGCFWCTEAVFLQLKGVLSVTPGYAGGPWSGAGHTPSYEEVSSGRAGHAEVVKIEYDPDALSFRELLEVFFSAHDPTTVNRQGADVGAQYRSIILYTTDEQKQEAENAIAGLTAAKKFDQPIVTEVRPLGAFYPAEEYHRNYYEKNPDAPYAGAVIAPKVEKIRREHSGLLKECAG